MYSMSGVKQGKGGNTSSVEYAPWKLKRMRIARRRQEARWARLAGPVIITRVTTEEEEEITSSGA